MDRYEKALELARAYYDKDANAFLDTIFPELKENEDEKIRKALVCHLKADVDFVSNGVTKAECLAYLDKQKDHFRDDTKMVEQKPANPSDEELQRHQDELYNFKVFAARQAREHHISFVHDFEWNNFYEELLSYFNEKQKPAGWSAGDEKKIHFLSRLIEFQVKNDEYCFGDGRLISKQEAIEMLKSLRSSWKPSEEQMEALGRCVEYLEESDNEDTDILAVLYEQLKQL